MVSQTNNLETKNTKVNHIKILDFLRGIAALSVVIFHFVLPNGILHKLYVPTMHKIFERGNLGVEIFFVISGFIIPYSLVGKGYTPKRFVSYLMKRIIRISPPAYASMILIIFQYYMIEHFVTNETPYLSKISFMQILNNLLFTIPFTKYPWISGVFWTLAIEFEFYIFIGLLFNILYEKKILFFYVLFFIIGLIPYKIHPYSFFEYSPLFAMGGLTLHRKQNSINNVVYLGSILAFFALSYYNLGFYPTLAGACTTLAIQYLSFSNKVSSFLGKISYSLYLTHLFVGLVCQFILIKFISSGPLLNKLVMQILCILIAIGSSYIFYSVVEKPFIKLAARFRG